MSKLVSLTSREEVLSFLQMHDTPLLQCEFAMVIKGKLLSSRNKIILTDFDCPDSGVKWAQQSDKLGFVKAGLNYSPINISFLSDADNGLSEIHRYYDGQFAEGGLIKASNKEFPEITIMALIGSDAVTLFSCSGCRFTYPIPIINLATPKFTTYKTVVTYNSFKYGV